MTDPFIGNVVGGRFKVSSRIGEGGMGLVYFAEDQETGDQAAVKFLHRHLLQNAEFVARFRQEAKSANSFRHEHAVKVIDSGEDENGVPFIAMNKLTTAYATCFAEELKSSLAWEELIIKARMAWQVHKLEAMMDAAGGIS